MPESVFWSIEVRDQIRVHEPDHGSRSEGAEQSEGASGADVAPGEGSSSVPSYAPFVRVAVLRCPECGADRGWTAMGAWTDPVRLICPVGHAWTPWEDDPDKGRSLMQELIIASGIEEADGDGSQEPGP
ncbi:hypothetical protein ACIQNI_14595 [Streptomyces sp. NPDC091266]|uniref:hypothetical protein n=1 Tax=Streptomyces sp. NPDC091266 TaxID=3365978 RepID=UPI0038044FCA